jgi:hypothetical protein
MHLQSGLQNYIWLPFSWEAFVGFLITYSATTFLGGTSTPRDMLYGMS